ncbi:hypothetical protein ACET3Z_010693 [Daucus carota]
MAFVLLESRKQYDTTNREFNKFLKTCIEYNNLNKDEEFQTRVDAAQILICSEFEKYETASVQPEKACEESSHHTVEPLINVAEHQKSDIFVEERVATTDHQFDIGIPQGAEAETSKINDPVCEEKEVENQNKEKVISPVQSSIGSDVLRMIEAVEHDYQQKINAQVMAPEVIVLGIATQCVYKLGEERNSDAEMDIPGDKAKQQDEEGDQDGKSVKILDNTNCLSFPLKQQLTAHVVDAFFHILNMNEMYKEEESPLRLYVPYIM